MTETAAELLVICASHSPGMARDTDRVQGPVFRAALQDARRAVEDFAPDLAVVFGPDHRRALRTIVPAFTVALSARGLGDMGTPAGAYLTATTEAEALVTGLLADDIDVAAARDIELDHGIGQTLTDLTGSLSAIPTIPIVVNCATAPLPPVRRAQALGRAVGGFLRELGRRALVVGSGGLSHAPPSLAANMLDATDEQRTAANREGRTAAAEWIDPSWDQRLLRALAENDHAWLRDLEAADIDPAGWGAHEVRAWIAAHAAGGISLSSTYEAVPEWITGMAVGRSEQIPGERP